MENVTKPPLPVWTNFKFTGDSVEYFKIWIVNILLTIITLGLYSPWAKVRTLTYFYGNTYLNDSSFSFLADPVKILKGRIIAAGVFAIYFIATEFYPEYSLWALIILVLLFPFIMVTAMAFRLRNTAYRNLRFYFRSDYAGAYRLFIIPLGIALGITAFLYLLYIGSDFATQLEAEGDGEIRKEDFLFTIFFFSILPVIPYIDYARRKFIVNRTQYGTAKGSFHGTAGGFYKVYLIALAMVFGIFFIFFLATIVLGLVAAALGISLSGDEPGAEAMGFAMIFVFIFTIIFYGIGFFVLGYIIAATANLTYNNTEIGPLRLQSNLNGFAVGWILLSNTIAIIFTVGLLIPWSRIRMARYVASRTEYLEDKIETINAIAQTDKSAIGEEIGDMFDFDVGL